MKKSLLVLIVLATVLVIWGWSGYNHLIKLNEQADAQWSQVESQYQRRFDLIPNLVNSVKASLTQEQTVFSDIANARAQYSGASTPDAKAAAASQVETSLGRLIAIVESYPQLNSSKNIQDLMTELEGTENRVSVERMRFNDIVRDYNTTIKQLPTNVLALLTGFHERAYFQSTTGADKAPTVQF